MDKRPLSQIREHYEIEKAIADRLRNSTADERKDLYTWAYDELFLRVPSHPLLHGDSDSEKLRRLKKEAGAVAPLVTDDSTFVEIGPGDCSLSLEMCRFAKKVYAVDVSTEVTKRVAAPPNFTLIISDGSNIRLPSESADVVYSNQLMEHLHPDDALQQLNSIYAALKPGGFYYCITPNRLSGPHDISRDFDMEATGLHLREFTVSELDKIFKEVGFRKTRVYLRAFKMNFKLPLLPFKIAESIILPLPDRIRKLVTFNRVVRFVLGIKLLATK